VILDNTLQLNADAFYYDQHNYQLLDFYMPYIYGPPSTAYTGTNQCSVPQGSAAPVACNGPTLSLNAHVYGLEFQSRYNVTPDDQFNLSAAFLDARFDNNQNGADCVPVAAGAPAGGCYAAGNNPVSTAADTVFFEKINGLVQPHAPTASGNFSYQHTVNLASGATVTAGVQIFASSGFYVHPIESPYSYQPAYWTQGLNAAYTAASGTWSVNGYVRNLSNYAIKTSLNPQVIGEPRTFGVVANYRF
jgi:iron complex outermembrane recepter protein